MKQVLRQEALLENRRMFHNDEGSIYQENMTVLNWHAPNYSVKTNKKDESTITVENFKTPFTVRI